MSPINVFFCVFYKIYVIRMQGHREGKHDATGKRKPPYYRSCLTYNVVTRFTTLLFIIAIIGTNSFSVINRTTIINKKVTVFLNKL